MKNKKNLNESVKDSIKKVNEVSVKEAKEVSSEVALQYVSGGGPNMQMSVGEVEK